MKKLILAVFLTVGMLKADFFNISGGYGVEQQIIGGYVKGSKGKNYFGKKSVDFNNDPYTGYFGLKNKTHPYFWIKLTHKIPFVPNFKFRYVRYESSGHSNYIASNVTVFGKVSINTILTDADTYMSIDAYEGTAFYCINTSIGKSELGLGADYWRGTFRIYDNVNKKYVVNYQGSLILPYLYGSLNTVKLHGFSFVGIAKVAKIGDKHHYDFSGGIKYSINLKNIIEPFVKIGYKYKEAYYKDSNDNTTKLSYKGAFLEIGAKF
ncbi:TIGR04219 family outer membrane beta-barrel protein [Caminibacter pacificus]|jgi:outer membrane protein